MTDQYDSALQQEGRDLGAFASSGNFPPPLFRDAEIDQVVSVLKRRRSVLLVGPEGAGKTSVIVAVAGRLRQQDGQTVRELSTTQFLAGTKYIGEWQTKLTAIVKAAGETNTHLFITDSWNLPDVGKTANSQDNLWDALRPFLHNRELQLLGEVTPTLLERVQKAPGFSDLFEIVRIKPLEPDQIREVVAVGAQRRGTNLDAATCGRALELCERFLPAIQGPGPVLRLVEWSLDYSLEKDALGEHEAISPEFVEKVFSIYTGLPLFVVARSAVRPVAEIRDWFRERIIGQEAAIDAIVEMIALFKAGLQDPQKPLGTFLFVGPTGVGKTELARALATFLFGSPSRLLRFDLSEFKDYHAFEMLVGAPDRPESPARLVDPVRTNPFQVILLDELEKAHQNVWDLLLQLLDDGRLTPPRGGPVNFRNTIVIATTNAGVQEVARRSIGFADTNSSEDALTKIREALEITFRPEFLNRFQHLAFFHHLTRDQVAQIARQEIRRVLSREGLSSRNLVVDVADETLAQIIEDGFDSRYGARALKREIQHSVILPIATLLMERKVEPGSILKVIASQGRTDVRVLESAATRTRKQEREPIRTGDGKRYTKQQIVATIQQLSTEIEALARRAGETEVQHKLHRLEAARRDPGFWEKDGDASRVIREIEYLSRICGRIERLREGIDNLRVLQDGAVTRYDFARLTKDLLQLQSVVQRAWRELIRMGRDGEWDAIVEITPLGVTGRARQLVFDTYLKWAKWRGMGMEMLHEPMTEEEPVVLGVRGDYAYGLLHREAGHHRVRGLDESSVVRVRVAPWTDRTDDVRFLSHRALKKTGQLGGRVRSRLEIAGINLVLQNAKTLAENRELAMDVAPSWAVAPKARDEVVRRYDLKPFLLRDYLTGIKSGRADALRPHKFNELLCQRVDIEAE